jgi:hypothetical protein
MVHKVTRRAQHTWVGTDIEDDYFPAEHPSDTSYHHQSMTEPWPKDWEGTFDLVHSRMALPGVGTNSLLDVVNGLVVVSVVSVVLAVRACDAFVALMYDFLDASMGGGMLNLF